MRIVFLLSQDLESPSGLGRYWPLGKELRRLGHDVAILALHPNYAALQPEERRFVREGVQVRYVGQMHVRKAGNQKSYFKPARLLQMALLATLQLTRAALSTPTDVYHVGKPHPMNGIAGLMASRLRRRSLYLDCDDFETASNRFNGAWQKCVVSTFERLLPRASEAATTNTHFMADKLADFGASRESVVYVPNGVERSRFSPTSNRKMRKLREELNLQTRKIVLYLGSMSLTNHAVDLLLEAFAVVRQTEREAVLLMVGGGENYEDLRAQARMLNVGNSVRFVGRVAPALAPCYYRLANVCVDPVRDNLASRARSPLKVMESLASATPVVTGDVGDRSELLADGGGILVPPDDPLALAGAILRILQDEDLHDRLSAEGLKAREQYYWDNLVQKFVQVYETTG